ncbi:MAG: cytotoxic translational repressor of toxin-antitoxin stability system [Gaiellales bacterium]
MGAHEIWTRALPDGTLARTQISHSATKTPSPGRFRAILRDQLRVSEDAFWRCLSSGEPVPRPGSLDPQRGTALPAHLVRVLEQELRVPCDEIATLTLREAETLVHRHWSGIG